MPQIFEFYFNPKSKEDLAFESFCFEPKNIYEKRMGGLYMVGFLKNVLPQNARFLQILAEKIKEKYYKNVSLSSEKSLRETLRTANEHLEKVAKQGDVSWLGNLSFTVISLKKSDLNLTKVGDFKIFLIRKGQLIDIDQRLKFDEIEPYPLKIFGNIVSGKLAKNDVVLILSKEAYETFLKEGLLEEIARKSLLDPSLKEDKIFKNVLNGKKEQLAKISGICLLMVLSEETMPIEKEIVKEKKQLKVFSFKEAFNPLLKILGKIKIPKISFKKPRNPFKNPRIKLTRPKFFPTKTFRIKLPKITFSPMLLNKKAILILILAVFLILGFFIFEKKEEKIIKDYQIQINEIQEKLNEAESYLIVADYNPQAKKNANDLYKEAWEEIVFLTSPSSKLPLALNQEVSLLKEDIFEELYRLSKLTEIQEPETVFEFKIKEFIPQKMISFKNELYFFTPLSENVFKLNRENEGEIIENKEEFNLATPLAESILFFSQPNKLIRLKDNQFSQTIYLQEPFLGQETPSYSFIIFSSYLSHLYFLDQKNNLIIRYPHLSELSWQGPELWLSPEIKTAIGFKSMTVDGSIWLLTKKNSIERYYAGRLEETVELEIFPYPKNLSKIFTAPQLPYLYILEPEQKRIIILEKSGQIFGQFQSQKFDNLLDFAVSEDGKTIYLLNGLKVYRISL